MNTNIANKYPKIAVLLGGNSPERSISIASGTRVLDALVQMGCNAYAFDPKKTDWKELAHNPPSVSVIMLHGGAGENGQVQAWHDIHAIPYTGSDHTSCAIAINKNYTKCIWQQAGLLVPKDCTISSHATADELLATIQKKSLNYPMIIKPNEGGSSIQLHVANNTNELLAAWKNYKNIAAQIILIEEYIVGDEFTVSMLSNQLLPSINIKTANGLYDYQAKYEDNSTQFIFDALSTVEEQNLQNLANKAFRSLGVNSWGRVDCIKNQRGEFYFLEVNLVPGMTSHSLLPSAAEHININYQQMITYIITQKEGI